MRLIDAEDVLRYLKFRRNCVFESPTSTLDAKFEIMEAVGYVENRTDTVDAAPVVHGRWDKVCTEDGRIICYFCSVCDSSLDSYPRMHYCPNCGALMDLPDGKEKQNDG